MTTLGSGKYTYTAILDWAKLPPGETFETVSAVATDQSRAALHRVLQRMEHWLDTPRPHRGLPGLEDRAVRGDRVLGCFGAVVTGGAGPD